MTNKPKHHVYVEKKESNTPSSSSTAASSQRDKQNSKLVIRRLPINLTSDEFYKHIQPYESLFNYIYYHPGKKRSTVDGSRQSVAYLNLMNNHMDSMYDIIHELHQIDWYKDIELTKHELLYERTIEIEYAPYQQIPRKPLAHSNNPRMKQQIKEETKLINTYQNDNDYIEFVKQRQATPNVLPSAEKQLEQREAELKKMIAAGNAPSSQYNKQAAIIEYLVSNIQNKNKEKRERERDSKQQQHSVAGDSKATPSSSSSSSAAASKSTPLDKKHAVQSQTPTQSQQHGNKVQYKPKAVLMEDEKKRRKDASRVKRVHERLKKLQQKQQQSVSSTASSTSAATAAPLTSSKKEKEVDKQSEGGGKKQYRKKDATKGVDPDNVKLMKRNESSKQFVEKIAPSNTTSDETQQQQPAVSSSSSASGGKQQQQHQSNKYKASSQQRREPVIASTHAGQLTQPSPRTEGSPPHQPPSSSQSESQSQPKRKPHQQPQQAKFVPKQPPPAASTSSSSSPSSSSGT